MRLGLRTFEFRVLIVVWGRGVSGAERPRKEPVFCA